MKFVQKSVAVSVVLFTTFLFTITARASQAADEQVTIVSHVDIKPDYAFPHAYEMSARILRAERAATQHDAGMVSYQLFQETASPNHFTIVETWSSSKSYALHEGSDHTVKFRNDIQPLLGSPFDARVHHSFQ
jgi:quinol monooxygenase YgiN